ncbi:DUF5916 domain-containing protein [Oceanihabitans sp. 2_MG-2023]|uniref:DUF5916 domain-containing protein n=1 Tax=Oceanihabitans sp. 2_MG-2023 TaxID=3062661 RepID=UPI0026E438CA|nr:DUF5916 domain-containing protein [Oceanihabitans sp. 2_MG-2023]MDO6596817.1 DUF5916 domain-containing protein [Oceanihabitans sp. 2_MG-2023]
MRHLSIFLLAMITAITLQAQEKKSLNIKRTDQAPKIDAILDDTAWQDAEVASDFIQFRPDAGALEKEYQKTEVRVTYNDNAIFFAAYLHDKPEEIIKQFSQRDNFGISDFFGIVLNPNNDAQNDVEFFVFPTGHQADAIANPSIGEDFGWNAVWESATKIVEDGWIVEVKIPYSTLRFSNQKVQTWGLQFHRRFRTNGSQYAWNPINVTKGNIGLYHGEINGIENIEPPTRLSFYPFASATYNSLQSPDYGLGMDLKYGISENFTLDATLIPDFSQAGFDDVQLNLGPFEQQFSEQRQFFTEGVDLFSKGNLFYSRRIGSAPIGEVTLNDNEEIIEEPERVNMLNAIKVSGRTKNGLGIGVFNAITEKTKAQIKDNVTNATREEVIEPLANYNILVVDQQFNKNSSVSLINTNVTRNGHARDANVTGLLLDLVNKNNTYGFIAQAKRSDLNLPDENNQVGYSTNLGFGKNSGKYRFYFEHEAVDKKYDINDMGILFRNNYSNFYANGSYRIFEPTKTLNDFQLYVNANVSYLFKPHTYTGKNFNVNFNSTIKKNLMGFGAYVAIQPGKQYDYFGPRAENRYFISEDWLNMNGWISSNYNKTFALDANLGYETLFESGRDYTSYFFSLSPRLKLGDRFIMQYSFDYDIELKERGYVETLDNDAIIYGQRDQETIINSISGSYNFNSFHALNLTFRNYWSTVTYEDDLYALQENGRLNQDDGYTKEDVDNPDVNFDTWNLDLSYSWQFAPGSQLTALYRNNLLNFSNASEEDYFTSLDNLFKEDINHTFSIRMVYYIDYNNVKNIFKSKPKNI